MELPADLISALNAIRDDNLQGAAALASEAALLVKRAMSHPELPAWPETQPFLVCLAKALVDAQPVMAPMFTLANSVLMAAEPEKDAEGLRRAVVAACEAFDVRIRTALIRIARLTNDLLPDGSTVLTHSASQTIVAAFTEARRSGKNLLVYCTESRPQREGVDTARKLAEIGCRVKLIVDAAAYHIMDQVSVVLVGADAISRDGLTNKIGTALLALAAAEKGRPVYALCGTEKWLPSTWPLPPEPSKPSTEVLKDSLSGVEAVNYYFGLCPLDRLTAIVSEEGIERPEDVRARLDELSVHPALLR
jgi:translation initiation factor eIF-2B subunit delta